MTLNGIECSTSRPGRFIPGKESRYALNMRLGDPQNRSGRFGENYLVPAGIRTQGRPTCSLVTIQITLYRLPTEVLYSVIPFHFLPWIRSYTAAIHSCIQVLPAEISKLRIFQQISRNLMNTLYV